jgi:hypothetical protein
MKVFSRFLLTAVVFWLLVAGKIGTDSVSLTALPAEASAQVPRISFQSKDNLHFDRLRMVAEEVGNALNGADLDNAGLTQAKMVVEVEWGDLPDGPHDLTLHYHFDGMRGKLTVFRHDAWEAPPYLNPTCEQLAALAAKQLAHKLKVFTTMKANSKNARSTD